MLQQEILVEVLDERLLRAKAVRHNVEAPGVFSLKCAFCSVQCAVCSVQYELCSVQSAVLNGCSACVVARATLGSAWHAQPSTS